MASNCLTITWISALCQRIVRSRALRVQVWRMSSLSSADTNTTQQSRGNFLANRGLRYKVRIATVPDMTMVCGTVAGIQTARCVGTTQAPSPVRTVMTPQEA